MPTAASRPEALNFAGWRLDLRSRALTDPEGAGIDLSGAEHDLLLVFLEHPGRVLGREQILEMSRGRLATPSDRSVDTLVSRLRRKLEPPDGAAPVIKTVRGSGYMLAAKVEDMINTVVRQIAFYTFERKVHTERRNGELTSDKINEIWMSVQTESLGPAIELKPGYETFWSYIPHFIHSPFYVYAYAFGDCLVNSLYAVYEKANEGFAERYLAMLAAGGTKHHSELLKPFGLDARAPSFWQGGIGVIERMIGELEALG